MTPSLRPRPPRWAAPALAIIAAVALLALFLAIRPERPPGLTLLIALIAVLAVWGLSWVIRLTLARREDHYVEDVEDGDLP